MRRWQAPAAEADPALAEGAWAYTRKGRNAQGLLDDAINLFGVLLDALEKDADTRAEQAGPYWRRPSSAFTRRAPAWMSRRVRIRICSWRISRGRKRKERKPGRRWMAKPFANVAAVGETAAALQRRISWQRGQIRACPIPPDSRKKRLQSHFCTMLCSGRAVTEA